MDSRTFAGRLEGLPRLSAGRFFSVAFGSEKGYSLPWDMLFCTHPCCLAGAETEGAERESLAMGYCSTNFPLCTMAAYRAFGAIFSSPGPAANLMERRKGVNHSLSEKMPIVRDGEGNPAGHAGKGRALGWTRALRAQCTRQAEPLARSSACLHRARSCRGTLRLAQGQRGQG